MQKPYKQPLLERLTSDAERRKSETALAALIDADLSEEQLRAMDPPGLLSRHRPVGEPVSRPPNL